MKLGYFPGCSLLGTARELNESTFAVARKAGIELSEIPDWNCCGSTAAHNLNHLLSLALPARILALAEKAGLSEVLVPCSACYNRLAVSQYELNQDEGLKKDVSDLIEMEFKGTTKILNIVEFMAKILEDENIKIEKPFAHKVACYYGCLLVRPAKVLKFDRAEDPQTMDELMRKIGAETIDWPDKVECCGAGLSVSRTDIVAKLSGRIVESASKRGAEAIIVGCPMCHSNLDMRRNDIEKAMGKKYAIPVVYITQAIGLALGLSEKELGLHRHLVPVVFPEKVQPEQAKPTESQPADKVEE